MVYTVYILQSESSGRYYCGQTNDLSRRLSQHNDPLYHGSKTTKRFAGPWVLVWNKNLSTRAEAIQLEHQIKNSVQLVECRQRQD